MLHFTSVGALIFQFALLLSLLPLEDLFLGQMDILNTSLCHMISHTKNIIQTVFAFVKYYFSTNLTVSRQMASSSFVATTTTFTLESGVEIVK